MPWETVANCVNCGCQAPPTFCPAHTSFSRRRLKVIITNRQGCECVDGHTSFLYAADVPGFNSQWIEPSFGLGRFCDPDPFLYIGQAVLRCDVPGNLYLEHNSKEFGTGIIIQETNVYQNDFGFGRPVGRCIDHTVPPTVELYPLEGFTLIDLPSPEPLFIQYRGVKVCGLRPFLCGEDGRIDITIIQDDP